MAECFFPQNMSDAVTYLKACPDYLYRYYGKKVIILLDEYDTPMQEAYVDGYWKELTDFFRNLFSSTFKTNPWLERAILTGITRISKESIFSDLNNPKVVTTTSSEYAETFGFTEQEVFAAMNEYGYTNRDEVKEWYDGFIFGTRRDIYNPWSILNFLDTGTISLYWANNRQDTFQSRTGTLLPWLCAWIDCGIKRQISRHLQPRKWFWQIRCNIRTLQGQ